MMLNIMSSKNEPSFARSTSSLPFDFTSVTKHSVHAKHATFANNTTFEDRVLWNGSNKATFTNMTTFNNDLHVTNIDFGGDVMLDEGSIERESKTSVLANATRVNDVFTDSYIGDWTNEEYVIKRLRVEGLEDSEQSCKGTGHVSKNTCISKMWSTVRDAEPLTSSVCDCCCKNVIHPPFCMVKLINSSGDDIVLKTNNVAEPAYYSIQAHEHIDAIYMTKTNGVQCQVSFFYDEKVIGDDGSPGQYAPATYKSEQFNNTVIPFRTFNNSMRILPQYGHVAFVLSGSFGGIYINTMNRAEHRGSFNDEDMTFHFQHNPSNNTYKLKQVKSGKYFDMGMTDARYTGSGDFKIIPEKVKSKSSNQYYTTGFFWIVDSKYNLMLYVLTFPDGRRFIAAYPFDPNPTYRWRWIEVNKQLKTPPYSDHINRVGVKLDMISVPQATPTEES